MAKDLFAKEKFGKIALKRIGNVNKNFRLFLAGWMGKGDQRDIFEVRGAEFREAKTGKNKGKLCIKVPGTERKVYLTQHELK